MPQIGPLEILTLAAVALIVFGPQRLPEIARTIGKTLSELRRQANEIRGEFASSFDEEDEGLAPEPPEAATAQATELEPDDQRPESAS